MTIPELLSEFDGLDWQDRYQVILDYGRNLAPMPLELKNHSNRITACATATWVAAELDGPGVRFLAASESPVICGFLAMLLGLTSGLSAQDVAALRFNLLFEGLGVQNHVSTQRQNGLQAVAQRMRQLAKQIARSRK